jgi:hypothetical protein
LDDTQWETTIVSRLYYFGGSGNCNRADQTCSNKIFSNSPNFLAPNIVYIWLVKRENVEKIRPQSMQAIRNALPDGLSIEWQPLAWLRAELAKSAPDGRNTRQ